MCWEKTLLSLHYSFKNESRKFPLLLLLAPISSSILLICVKCYTAYWEFYHVTAIHHEDHRNRRIFRLGAFFPPGPRLPPPSAWETWSWRIMFLMAPFLSFHSLFKSHRQSLQLLAKNDIPNPSWQPLPTQWNPLWTLQTHSSVVAVVLPCSHHDPNGSSWIPASEKLTTRARNSRRTNKGCCIPTPHSPLEHLWSHAAKNNQSHCEISIYSCVLSVYLSWSVIWFSTSYRW